MNHPHHNFNALIEAEKYWQQRLSVPSDISHPTAKGDALEKEWCDLLRGYLPDRYRINTGFIVSSDNKRSDQIDCIIHDSVYTPILFNERGITCIPVEAVYAIFEIKPKVTPGYITYAFNKAATVRSLHRTSTKYTGSGKVNVAKDQFGIIAGLLARRVSGKSWDRSVNKINTMSIEQPLGKLQIVLTADNGSFYYFDPASQEEPRINPEKGGLMLGLFRFLKALQQQGTVPAIDWDEWIQKMV